MSPEQARGQAVDKRADIWAFGCVLYELLTGQRAMKGDTVSDILASVLTDEPDWSRLPATTPPRVVALLQRCLTKDPRDRQRDIGDVRFELMEPGSEPRLARHRSPVRSPSARLLPSRRSFLPHWADSLTPYGHAPRGRGLGQSTCQRAVHTITDFPGTETHASISPDGRFVAFLSDRDGPMHVWLTQVGSGRFTDLTRAEPSIASTTR